jgi:hypothetical protein
MTKQGSTDDWTGGLIGLFVVLPFVSGCVVMLWEYASWLGSAEWPNTTVLDGLNWFRHWFHLHHLVSADDLMTRYLGLNELVRAVLNRPLASSLMWASAIGLGIIVIATKLRDAFRH